MFLFFCFGRCSSLHCQLLVRLDCVSDYLVFSLFAVVNPIEMAFIANGVVARLPVGRGIAMSRGASVRMCGTRPLNGDSVLPMKEMYQVSQGKKVPVCRCWQSKKHPICDGSHNAYNKQTGDHLGPLVVSVADAQ